MDHFDHRLRRDVEEHRHRVRAMQSEVARLHSIEERTRMSLTREARELDELTRAEHTRRRNLDQLRRESMIYEQRAAELDHTVRSLDRDRHHLAHQADTRAREVEHLDRTRHHIATDVQHVARRRSLIPGPFAAPAPAPVVTPGPASYSRRPSFIGGGPVTPTRVMGTPSRAACK
eukprot:TRINITY_DN10459_c0_g2_i1.p1 TRINITY_DN10459_c0_g2~~TRINITY_DN10459_c0_g2_i1.p1  ORF type:complete len:175 (+),score=18.54 TRINITY_DN10459_c0_g2_i1:2-526(+)